jgi:hypothetical protein
MIMGVHNSDVLRPNFQVGTAEAAPKLVELAPQITETIIHIELAVQEKFKKSVRFGVFPFSFVISSCD